LCSNNLFSGSVILGIGKHQISVPSSAVLNSQSNQLNEEDKHPNKTLPLRHGLVIYIVDRQRLIILPRSILIEMLGNKLDETSTKESQSKPANVVTEGRRSLLQIKVDILRAVSAGYGKPTQIMYRANLSWNVLQAQLRSFIVSGMLEVEEYGSRRRYMITAKGIEMVDSYQKVVSEILK
jgi:predicted transcriptional regulator